MDYCKLNGMEPNFNLDEVERDREGGRQGVMKLKFIYTIDCILHLFIFHTSDILINCHIIQLRLISINIMINLIY